jgi:hypothetical protein
MKKTLIIAGLLIGASALTVPIANANTDTDATSYYLQRVQARMPYVLTEYGSTAMVNEGYRICGYEAKGVTGASDLADLIVADMPMSRSSAITLQVLAEVDLGC